MSTLHDGDELVGWAGYQQREIDRRARDGARLADPPRPLGARAMRARRRWQLRPLGPERTIHLIHPDNAASIAVARKLGAVCEREITINRRPVALYVSHLGGDGRSKLASLVRSANQARKVPPHGDRGSRVSRTWFAPRTRFGKNCTWPAKPVSFH